MKTINEYIKETRNIEPLSGIEKIRPRVQCMDGYSVSVQVGSWLYCSPRVDGAAYYDEVELGYPSEEDPLINDYAENSENYTDTVYGYVPVEIIDALLQKHGGIVN